MSFWKKQWLIYCITKIDVKENIYELILEAKRIKISTNDTRLFNFVHAQAAARCEF